MHLIETPLFYEGKSNNAHLIGDPLNFGKNFIIVSNLFNFGLNTLEFTFTPTRN